MVLNPVPPTSLSYLKIAETVLSCSGIKLILMTETTKTLRQAVKRWRETNGEGTRRALDVLAVAFAVFVFARGFDAHAGFAVAMAVFLGTYFRIVSGVVAREYGVDVRSLGGPAR